LDSLNVLLTSQTSRFITLGQRKVLSLKTLATEQFEIFD